MEYQDLKRFAPLEALNERHLKEVFSHAEVLKLPAGKMIFKRNQANQNFYYVLKGEVDILDSRYQVTTIRPSPNEITHPLDTADPYQLSAVTTTETEILSINKVHLDLVLAWSQAGDYLVEEVDSSDNGVIEKDWLSYLLVSPLFQQVPPVNLQELFVRFEEIPVIKGENVVKQGEAGEYFFVIKSGTAEVYRDNGQGQQLLAKLDAGQFFGEDALVGDTPRNATITMATDGRLMRLGKSDFKHLLESPLLHEISYRELEELRQQGVSVKFLDVRLPSEIPNEDRQDRMNIPLPELRARLEDLNQDSYYVLHPEAGHRASIGNYLLSEAGFQSAILRDL